MFRFRDFGICVLLLLVSLFCFVSASAAAVSSAEKLQVVLPDDVLGFVATSGSDELKPAFEKSILGRMWNDPGTRGFYRSVKQAILNKIKQEIGDPNDAKIIDAVESLVKVALKRPIVVGVTPKDIKDGDGVYGFAILDAGQAKGQIASAIAKIEAFADSNEIIDVKVGAYTMHGPKDKNEHPGYWGWVGNYFVLAVNDEQGLAIKHLQNEESNISRLTADYLSTVPASGDLLAVYIDRERIFNVLDAVARKQGEVEEFNQVKAVIKELGLDKVKTLVSRVGFSGSEMVVEEFTELSGPRTGLLANLKTLDISMFDMVHASAMNAVAWNCDIAGVYDTVINAIEVVEPNQVQSEIAEFESEAKFNIRKGLLESIAGPMVCYTLPKGAMMEAPQGGGVLIAKLKDPSLFEKTMTAMETYAAANSDGMLQVSSQVKDGNTLHTWAVMPLAMMQVMPTWMVTDDKVVIASNMSVFNLAVKQIDSGTGAITSLEGYKKVTANLPENLLCLRYADSKLQFSQMMMSVQQFWPMVTMMASKEGVMLPFVLPSLSQIINEMEPSCSYCWFDSWGLRSRYRGTGVELAPSVAGVSLGIGIMMPALARTRQLAQATVSASNLSAIGKACLIYANDYDDKYPPNLEELIEKSDLLPECLESPRKPKGFDGPSYIYIAGQTVLARPDNIIVYENPAFCRGQINVLFNDIHVEKMSKEDFMEKLEATYKRLSREMPEVKFKDD